MISVLRRLTIITLLFAVILFVQTIQVENAAGINPRTLISLGFIILASFALGEIFSIIKLPRVIGYILIGILFGPFSHYIFGGKFLEVFNSEVISNISLINTVALSLIALTAGTEIIITEIKKSLKTISLILIFKVVLLLILIPAVTYALSPFIGFLQGADFKLILAAGLILTVISLGTSIELTLVVVNDTKSKGRLADTILGTAILKDVLVILLLAVTLSISSALILPSGNMEMGIIADLALELFYSVMFGAALGIGLIFYFKYVRIEIILFVLAFIVFATQLSIMLHLETLIVFITTGFVFRNFSGYGEDLHHPLLKLSLPIFIIFFTVAGASIDLSLLKSSLIIAAVLTVVRGAALFISVRYASKIAGEPDSVKDYGWLGFFSIGGLILGLAIIIENKLGSFGSELKNIITAFVALNIFLGPVLFKIGLIKVAKKNNPEDESVETATENGTQTAVSKTKKKKSEIGPKFKEPVFRDESVNKILYQILFKLKTILNDFDRRFIQKRFEEAEELIISIMEKYVSDYGEIAVVLKNPELAPQKVKTEILNIQNSLSEWYIDLCEERKAVEKNILLLEPLIKELFFSLSDLTDSLPATVRIELLPDDLEKNIKSDTFINTLKKKYLLSKLKFIRLFNKKYTIRKNIRLKNIAKYYLAGITSEEILETINLTGIERLDTIKQVKRLFSDYFVELNNLAHFTITNKEDENFHNEISGKFDDFHKTFISEIQIYKKEISDKGNEISSRFEYAIANPFNSMLETLNSIQSSETEEDRIRFSKVFAKSEINKETSLESIRFWVNYYLGMLGLFQKEAYLDRLKSQLNMIVSNSLVSITDEVDYSLVSISDKLSKNITEFNSKAKTAIETDYKTIKDVIHHNIDELVLDPLSRFLENLEEIKRNRKLILLVETLIRELSDVTVKMPKSIQMLEEGDFHFDTRRPDYRELKNAPIREIARNFIEKKFIREIGEINELLMNQINLMLTEMRNFHSIINFHIDSILQEIDEETEFSRENAQNLIISLDEKLQFRISQLNQKIDNLKKDINVKVIGKVEDLFEKIDELISSKSIVSAGDKLVRLNRLDRYAVQLSDQADKLNYQLRKYRLFTIRYYRKYFVKSIRNLLKKAGIIISEEEQQDIFVNYLNQRNIQKLPFIYRKLFDAASIESEEFYRLHKTIRDKFEEALANYRKNKYTPAVITGNPGSGKGSLMRYLKNDLYEGEEIVELTVTEEMRNMKGMLAKFSRVLNLDRLNSVDQLIVALNDKSKKRIIFCENFEKIFFSRVYGYDNLKNMLHIVSLTGKNNFWIFSMNKFAWDYIQSIFMLRDYFTTRIDLDRYGTELREIILRRHNATGYNLKFIPGEIRQLRNRIFRIHTPEEEEKILEEKYFEKMAEYAEGNITAAFFYWMQSISDVGDNVLQIKLPDETDLKLKSLPDDIYYLTIKSILLHGGISVREHSELFKIPEDKSRDILYYLVNSDLVKIEQERLRSEYFTVSKILAKAVEKELSDRNLI